MRKSINVILSFLIIITLCACSTESKVNNFVNKYLSDFNFVIEKIDENNYLLKNNDIEANLEYEDNHFFSDISSKYFDLYDINDFSINIEYLDQYISIFNDVLEFKNIKNLYNLYSLDDKALNDVITDPIKITINTGGIPLMHKITSSTLQDLYTEEDTFFSFIKRNRIDSLIEEYVDALKSLPEYMEAYMNNRYDVSKTIEIYEVEEIKETLNNTNSIVLNSLLDDYKISVYALGNSFKEYSLREFIDIDIIDEYINSLMNNMTLSEKISQMFLIQNGGDTFTQNYSNYLNTLKPGGVVLFKNNLSTSVEKTINYINQVKSTGSIPLFIGIDQEGGSVQRLNKVNGASTIPEMYKVGQTNDEELAYNVGRVIGEELRVFGFNLDFAPCSDVYSNPKNPIIGKRAFSSDPYVVSKMATKLSDGLNSVGIISCYKHFPGHGNTSVDSHKDLPVIDKSLEELYKEELVPFIEAINHDARLIMIGHLSIPAISGNIPSSLSKELITDFLINKLGYDGLIVTDSLGMAGVTKYYSTKEIVTMAINAGVNLLLNPADPLNTVKLIENEVNLGNISLDNINNSVYKILKLKIDFVFENYNTNLDVSYLNNEDHKAIINKVNNY